MSNGAVMLLQAAVEGLAYGGLYALLGLGFWLTYGVLARIDLAYGTVIMASVYVAAMVASQLGLAWPLVPVLSLAVGTPLALGVAWLAFVLVRGDARFSMAATLGIWMAIEELILQSPGRGRGQPLANPVQDAMLGVAGLQLRVDHLLLLGLALAIAWGTARFLSASRHGLAIRVAAHDGTTARLLGMAPSRTLVLATALAAGVGCIAGWAFAMCQSAIDLHFGMWATIKGLVILALAGTERLRTVVIAGLVLGMAERIGTELLGTHYRDLLGYALMLALLASEPFTAAGRARLAEGR